MSKINPGEKRVQQTTVEMDAIFAMGSAASPEQIEALRPRLAQAAAAAAAPSGVHMETVQLGAQPALRLEPDGAAADAAILFLHGGFFRFGEPRLYAPLAGRLGAAARLQVYAPQLSRAPEAPFPAAHEEALAAYRALLALGLPGRRIVLAGDESGANAALGLAVAARAQGLPAPAALALFSPWVDLAQQGFSYAECAASDLHVREAALHAHAQAYLAGADSGDPRASPLHADLRGLPPLLVQVSAEEILLADAENLIRAARAGGGDATMELWSGVPHGWAWADGVLPEAGEAVEGMGGWLQRRL